MKYNELLKLKKKELIIMAGYKNMNTLLKDNANVTGVDAIGLPIKEKVTKKWLCRLLSD